MAVIDRNDPERLLLRREAQAARPRTPPPARAWPPGGEFVPPPRVTRGALPSSVRPPPWPEPPMQFVPSRKAAEAVTHVRSGGGSMPAAPPTPPEPQKPHSTPPHAGKRPSNVLAGKSLKCTIVVSPADVAAIVVRDGQPRVVLHIEVAGRVLTADISAKSARRAITAVREHGIDGVTAIVQGKLVGDRIDECGLAVQPKTPKPAAEAVAG